MENEPTSIPLKKGTRNRLGKFGDKNESWDRLLNRLMDTLVKNSFTDLELDAIVTLIYHHRHGGFALGENIEERLDSVSRKIGEAAEEELKRLLKVD